MKRTKWMAVLGCATALTLAGCGTAPTMASMPKDHAMANQASEVMPTAPVVVTLINTKGVAIGKATLTAVEQGTQVAIEASGLKPGLHGIHFHQMGKCEKPDFVSAGGHFNPFSKKHGLDNPEGPHAGDMPNLNVGPDGKVQTVFITKLAVLGKGLPNGLQKAGGSAIVIHEGADDQKTDPAGASGARVACGVIPAL